jgi:hypothetical protein
LGHIDQALSDPEGYLRDVKVLRKVLTVEEYMETEAEKYANYFATEASKNDPDYPTD